MAVVAADGAAAAGDRAGSPPVSVIVPARDAGDTLPGALRSIFAQEYDGPVEAIVAEGSADPARRERLRRDFPRARVLRNAAGTIPAGLNLALAAARHDIVARCDAHAVLPPGYLARAVDTLLRTGAANVGGRVRPAGVGLFGRAVALATSTPLGAGDARYRIGGDAGPVDTVFPGVFRREALEAAGGWDETLLRNEDYELNWRLRQAGGTVWFDPALAAEYRPRGGPGALARQYFDYGRWKREMLRRHPRALRPRQLAPPLLLAALAASAAAAAAGLSGAVLFPLAYLACLLAAAFVLGVARRAPEAALLPAVAATIHLAWAAGFFVGVPRAAPRIARAAGMGVPSGASGMGVPSGVPSGGPRPAAVRGNDWRGVALPDARAFVPSRPLSVIVPCFEQPEELALTLAGLERQRFPRELFEVVVVDDGSEPPIAPPPETTLALRIVRQRRRGFGLARARNAGANAAAHDVLVFLDGDVIPEAACSPRTRAGTRRCRTR